MISLLINILILIGYLILIPIIFLMFLSVFNKFNRVKYKKNKRYRPKFSLIVPAHNEEEVIEDTIKSFLATDYPNSKREMIIVNDDSTDKTEDIVKKYAYIVVENQGKKIIYTSSKYRNITLINKRPGGEGKAHAVNMGKRFVNGDI